jgi:hypothetical protein
MEPCTRPAFARHSLFAIEQSRSSMARSPSRASEPPHPSIIHPSRRGHLAPPPPVKTFQCTCRQPLFFQNRKCLACGSLVAYDPTSRVLTALKPESRGRWALQKDSRRPRPLFRFCAQREAAAACNWLVPADSPHDSCLSCRLTRTIPILDRPKNADRLREIETAKRRVLWGLQGLDLPLVPKSDDPEHGLAFDLLESLPGQPPVLTGHADGIITLNVAEADDDYRERNRENLEEPYRTVLGHLRHELAHYYWEILIRDTPWLPRFREVFGDEQTPYGAALRHHYAAGPPADWRNRFISAYAAAHPWEDWAESWAHYLHLRATLETVTSFKLNTAKVDLRIDPFTRDVLYRQEPVEAGDAFLAWINAWVVLTAVLNEIARSMGQPDVYPFVMNGPVVTKLHFVHCAIRGRVDAPVVPPPKSLAQPEG